MASAFWTLEDGRGFARPCGYMAYMLELITDEMQSMEEAQDFYGYLEKYVFRKDRGDELNGLGGFIRGDESIMFNFDLRSFAPKNRKYFWVAAQKALTKLKVQKEEHTVTVTQFLTVLLDMHKRINRGEDPMSLSHYRIIVPQPNEKLGPGWENVD